MGWDVRLANVWISSLYILFKLSIDLLVVFTVPATISLITSRSLFLWYEYVPIINKRISEDEISPINPTEGFRKGIFRFFLTNTLLTRGRVFWVLSSRVFLGTLILLCLTSCHTTLFFPWRSFNITLVTGDVTFSFISIYWISGHRLPSFLMNLYSWEMRVQHDYFLIVSLKKLTNTRIFQTCTTVYKGRITVVRLSSSVNNRLQKGNWTFFELFRGKSRKIRK